MAVTAYIFWLGLAEISFYISGFIVQSAAGHILGPADYGTFGLIVTLTILIASLIGNGIPIAMSKFLSSNLKHKPEMIPVIKRKSAIAQIVLMTIVTAIFFFGAPLIALALHDTTLTKYLRISAFISPCFAADAFYFYYYTGIHQFNMQSLLKGSRSILRILIIVGLGYFISLEGFISGYIYVPLFVFLIAVIIDKMVYARRFPLLPDAADFSMKKIIAYALPITGFLLLYQTMISLNLFIVKSVLQNDSLTGLFNGAFTISQIPNYLFYALTIVLLPIVSHSAANEHKKETAKKITSALRIMTIMLFPTIALIIGYAKPLMIFFFGAKFGDGASALQFMAFGVGLLTLFYVMSFAFQGAGLVRIPLKVSFFGMIMNVTLNFLLVKPYGLIGSGLATSITAVFVTFAMLFLLRQEFDAYLEPSTWVKIIFASLVVFILSFIFPGQKLLFIVSGAVLYAIYVAILYALKEVTMEDITLFKSMIPGKRKNA